MGFENYRKLGGHFSNYHPGRSTSFNHKKNVRERRANERVAY
jgi:hypothetical protein